MRVEVVRSERRKKTVQARLLDGVLRVAIPAHLSEADEAHWVATMRAKFERRLASENVDLEARARTLAGRHDLETPTAITWSDRQNTRWGSCSIATGEVRISRQLAAFPRWVLDYVIVHELAHLTEAGHNDRFWAIVGRYPLAERARGYLIAKSDGISHGAEPGGSSLPSPGAPSDT
jgi:predicted metal-dependent hydrolase